ncbi:hypothetical protein SNE40_020979 [Patella caerulea]|uniref:HAT C-terminal dimerisation domain-containing protein n=1 Tax=Patella caerulea TaxID=87958 RepID=A0AAN8G979_PATCE
MLNVKKPATDQPIIKAIINLEKHEELLLRRLFTTAFYLAKHEKPYTDFVYLNELQNKNFGTSSDKDLDVTKHYNNDKQANTFIHYIAKVERDSIIELIHNSEFISVALDGSTDCANLEEELFFVSCLDTNFEPQIKFFKIHNLKGRATALELKYCLYQIFEEANIDLKTKCVQLATDGPSVMKKMCNLVQDDIAFLLTFHCANHRLELALKDAMKDIPFLSETHELLNGIHNFYENSNLQSRMLKDTGDLMGVKIIAHPCATGTRWVAHHERALAAIDRNYIANVAQLQECHLDKSQRQETRSKAAGLRDKLLDVNIVIFMFVILRPLLAVITSVSCLLQTNDLSIDSLASTIRRAKTKLNEFKCDEMISSFQEEQINNHIFRDVQLKEKRSGNRNMNQDASVHVTVLNQSEKLLANLKQTISDRFGPLETGSLSDDITLCFRVFDLCNFPDSENDEIKSYGKDEIQRLGDHFSTLLTSKGYDPSKIEDERITLWEYVIYILKSTKNVNSARSIKTFWPKILRRKDQSPELRNILSLVKILLTLVFSTALVERGFSLMKRVKSDWRARLNESSLNDLMCLSLSDTTLTSFEPTHAMKLWWLDSNKSRRLVDAYGPRAPKHSDIGQ